MFKIQPVFNAQLYGVENKFWEYIYTQSQTAIMANRIPMFLLKNRANEIREQNSIIDILSSAPLANKCAGTLGTELAMYRYGQYIQNPDDVVPLTADMEQLLIVDYILKSCLCYIEVFKGPLPQKFFATRNVELLQFLQQQGIFTFNKDVNDPKVASRLRLKTQPLSTADMQQGMIQFLKLEFSKNTMKIIEPRNMTNLVASNIRITPFFLIDLMKNALIEKAKRGILEITYLKDNLVKRTVTTTLDINVATRVFENNHARACDVYNYAAERQATIMRGYLTLPDLELPLNDETGCRAVSFRLLTIREVDPNTFTNPFLHVDFEGVSLQYERFVELYKRNRPVLEILYVLIQQNFGSLRGITDTNAIAKVQAQAQGMPIETLTGQLTEWLHTALLIDKTQTLRKLHTLMINNPMIFSRYTGKRFETSAIDYTAGL